jgi:ABC-type glutathione transport system ATPase component
MRALNARISAGKYVCFPSGIVYLFGFVKRGDCVPIMTENPTDQRENQPELPLMVEMRGIVKRFPGVLANDHVDFDLKQGEIHALLGENGAGKSTLMNILAGLYRQDAGTITIKGKPVTLSSPKHAIQAGIGMVHQHFMLVPSQTVTENILLGLDEPRFRINLPEYNLADFGRGTAAG